MVPPLVKYLGVLLDAKVTWNQLQKSKSSYSRTKKTIPAIPQKQQSQNKYQLYLYKMCVRLIITYEHQIWAPAAKSPINKMQRTWNKYLRIFLNQPYDTPIRVHEIPTIQTIQDYIANLLEIAHHTEYENLLMSQTGNYNVNNIPLQFKKKFPKHAIATS